MTRAHPVATDFSPLSQSREGPGVRLFPDGTCAPLKVLLVPGEDRVSHGLSSQMKGICGPSDELRSGSNPSLGSSLHPEIPFSYSTSLNV